MSASESAFYGNHRGGAGPVIIAVAIEDFSGAHRYGVFSTLELAQEWSGHLGDRFACVFAPYIVDDPDWGNEANLR